MRLLERELPFCRYLVPCDFLGLARTTFCIYDQMLHLATVGVVQMQTSIQMPYLVESDPEMIAWYGLYSRFRI